MGGGGWWWVVEVNVMGVLSGLFDLQHDNHTTIPPDSTYHHTTNPTLSHHQTPSYHRCMSM